MFGTTNKLDLFYIAQGVHLTDLSFVGEPSQDGAAVMSYDHLLVCLLTDSLILQD